METPLPHTVLSYGGRHPTKIGNGRKRKGVDEYAAENRVDFTSRSIIKNGQLVQILVCRFCCQAIGARNDRIKEHLASKRHQKLKSKAFREAQEAGRDLYKDYSEEQPITLANLLKGDHGRRRQQTESTSTPERSPLKEHMISSPSPRPQPQFVHPASASFNQRTQSSGGGLVEGRSTSLTSSVVVGSYASPPPPPPLPLSTSTSKDSPSQQLLCVRWDNYDSNIVSMFSKFLSREQFIDVTLWCEGNTIKCHKMVLSANSVYFEKLLTEHPTPDPIIFLTDMRFWEVQALVEFMYCGEVSVNQDKLQALLRAAESLQIKGLACTSNEIGAGDDREVENSMDGDISVATRTSSSHINSVLPNHVKDDNNESSNSLVNSHQTLGATINNNNSSPDNNQAPWQKLTVVDLITLSLSANPPLPLLPSVESLQPRFGTGRPGSGSSPAKKRKKESPKKIDLPSTSVLPLDSTMESRDHDYATWEDSMEAHERNHIDENDLDKQQNQGYGDEDDRDPDELSSDREDMDEDQDGALSLRISNLSGSESDQISQKGNSFSGSFHSKL